MTLTTTILFCRLLLISMASCAPQQSGREVSSNPPVSGDADSGGPDGDQQIADVIEASSDPPPGLVIATATIGDDGAELRVEQFSGGEGSGKSLGFRLMASKNGPLSVEPLGQLAGPTASGMVFGRGCQRAEAEGSVFLGQWTGGSIYRCVTRTQPMAVMDGVERSPIGRGCTVEAVTTGTYELTLWPCGRYAEPLVTVSFEVQGATPPPRLP